MLIEGRREVRGGMNGVVSSGQLGPALLMDYTSALLGKWTPPANNASACIVIETSPKWR